MESGQGRLILCDGTAALVRYLFALPKKGQRRYGTIFGDLSEIDEKEFAQDVRFVPTGGDEISLLVTTFTHRYLTVISYASSEDGMHLSAGERAPNTCWAKGSLRS
ncbi:hypothetical protein ASE63_12395 [Bosea sp. Root381]|uniref:hypothetical protein n=1 Tax=Bosea sp. Root381 TaxID=1736524 RepID=UPI0006FC2ED3|nr:hypothetical protein [Bosea sp. Root381]KRD96199.1 hypothetical protein ASE63_12395 [Bosea sp. Root381]